LNTSIFLFVEVGRTFCFGVYDELKTENIEREIYDTNIDVQQWLAEACVTEVKMLWTHLLASIRLLISLFSRAIHPSSLYQA
jgi:hypothetical protein